jgi:hypothetical protein
MKLLKWLMFGLIATVTFTAWAGDADTYRGGNIKEIKGDTIVIDAKEPNTFKITEESWIRNEYNIPLKDVENGETVCIFGKPDKEKGTIKGSQTFILKNDNPKYQWATKGPVLKQDGKLFIDIESEAYEILLKDTDIAVRKDITKDELKMGQDVSLHGKMIGEEWTIDYLTVMGNMEDKQDTPKEAATETKAQTSENADAGKDADTKSADDVNIKINAINTGANLDN